jgi:glycosyltransferase involved in cell wall biosynthesis
MIRKVMNQADGVIAMMNTFLEWGLFYAEREKTWKDRVFYLGSKKSLPLNKRPNKIRELIDDLNNKFVVTFVGTVVSNNNPSILIECAKQIDENNICFVIAGDGDYFNEIRDKSLSLDNVILPGWLEQDEIDVLLRNSHVGFCPTTVNREAFPNKVFTYLSYGLPILSAYQGEMKEYIEKYKIGFYYPPGGVEALVGCIKKLYDDPSLRKKMSENALEVFHEKFDADKIYKEYAQHIELVGNN